MVGVGVGAALGILFAPRSGEETREYIADGVQDAVDDVVSSGRRFTKRAKRVVDDVTDQVKDAASVGQRVDDKAREAHHS